MCLWPAAWGVLQVDWEKISAKKKQEKEKEKGPL